MAKEKKTTKLCKHCKTEIPAGAKICPSCQKKQSRIMMWAIIGIVAIAIIGGAMGKSDSNSPSESKTTEKDKNVVEVNKSSEESKADLEDTKEQNVSEATTAPEVKNDDIPKEHKTALKKAQNYNDLMHMSKAGLYDQLTSDYGEKFSSEAAQYAIDNVNADWKANALEKAKEYQDLMSMSSEAIRDQLTSDYGEKFTPEEAQYAIDNLG